MEGLEEKRGKGPRSPYAVGMALAQELTGDAPPLRKSTITKAHDIARAIMRKESLEKPTEHELTENAELSQSLAELRKLSGLN